jgi:hypothetical protein
MLTLVLVAVGITSRDMQSLNRIIISIRTNMRKHHIKSWILLKPGTKKENVGVAMSPMKHSLKFPVGGLITCWIGAPCRRWKLAFVWFACIFGMFCRNGRTD